MKKTDYLVIGSGIAGLAFALKAALDNPSSKITVVTKATELDANTHYAQGGIATVTNFLTDSFEKHIEDTLIAGAGLCNREVVEMVIKEGPERINEIMEWGVKFDKNENGVFHLGREGGHSTHRVLHYKDVTGAAIQKAVLHMVKNQPNIDVLTHQFALDLVVKDGNCTGCFILDIKGKSVNAWSAKITVLATGGGGQVFLNTTNPPVATGDGIAMASRAGAEVRDMEFVQFHPTALYEPKNPNAFLISEAVRGFGALLKNAKGEQFMSLYDARAELAPRDVVARAIDNEIKKSGHPCVYLDLRHLNIDAFKDHFPNITSKCFEVGVDVAKDMIPVVPSAHYLCGGVTVDTDGKTSIANLYACGECASTGLHGANRLASNSLLEALVYAHHCFFHSRQHISSISQQLVEEYEVKSQQSADIESIMALANEVKNTMSHDVGIYRKRSILKEVGDQLLKISENVELMYGTSYPGKEIGEVRNLLTVGLLIVKGAYERLESIGAHYIEN